MFTKLTIKVIHRFIQLVTSLKLCITLFPIAFPLTPTKSCAWEIVS